MMAKKLLFLMPVASHVRYRKRLQALTQLGFNIKVLAFERPYYKGDPDMVYESLGKLEHGNYLKRIPVLLKSLATLRRYVKENGAIYCFGLDMLFLSYLTSLSSSKRISIVYEVGDIRSLLIGQSFKSKVARRVERFLLGRVDRLVLTSQAFYDHYYEGILKVNTPYQVIENKLEDDFVPAHQLKSPSDFIGYFGTLRCKHSLAIMQILARAGKSVYLRGYPRAPLTQGDLEQRVDNLKYEGPYLAPDELPDIYGRVELVWAAYPFEGNQNVANAKWARTNRFYEACYFRKPMIVQQGTEDARIVEKHGLGLALDLADVDRAAEQVLSITAEQMTLWKENLRKLDESVFMYTDEHLLLADFLGQPAEGQPVSLRQTA